MYLRTLNDDNNNAIISYNEIMIINSIIAIMTSKKPSHTHTIMIFNFGSLVIF